MANQKFNAIHLSNFSRIMKCRLAVAISGLDVGSHFDQQVDAVEVLVDGGYVERGLLVGVPGFNVGTPLQQKIEAALGSVKRRLI